MKKCTCCLVTKGIKHFNKKAKSKDGHDWVCRECHHNQATIYRIKKGLSVNESKYKAVVNGLSSVARKILESIPDETYWSISRISNEMYRKGIKLDHKATVGTLNNLAKTGLLVEAQQGVFAKTKITKAVKRTEAEQEFFTTKEEKEEEMATKPNVAASSSNAIDQIRESVLKLLDIAKQANAIALDIDAKLSEAEKQIDDNAQDSVKLKQLQTLLKGIG